MPISGYFDVLFASSGSKTTVPDAVQPSGEVSYAEGYGADYTLQPGTANALNVQNYEINQLFYDITSAIQQYQQHSTAPFITSAMNGGTAYSYSQYDRVLYSGVLYQSLENSNTDTPPSSKWAVADIYGNNVFTGGTTTGSANAQVLSSVTPTSTTFTNGQSIICTAGYSNTGSATFQAPGGSAVTIKKDSGSGLVVLAGGEIIAGDTIILTYNTAGTCWVLTAGFPLGTAAYKTASDNTKTNVASISGTPTTGDLAIFADSSGTIKSASPAAPIRAWVNFSAAGGTISIRASSSNVSSVTRTSTGQYVVNFSPSMTDANYVISGNCSGNFGTSAIGILTIDTTGAGGSAAASAPSTSACSVSTWDGGGTQFDATYINVSITGN